MKHLTHFDSCLERKNIGRTNFIQMVSPLLPLRNLSQKFNAEIFIKRDDLNEFGMGGNKLRKLEYLLWQALSKGANRIITVGARQSNHARLTATVARMFGLEVDLVLKNSVQVDTDSYHLNGNIVLDNLLDAKIHEIDISDSVTDFVGNLITHYESLGEKVFFIPVGGSNTVGGLGYARSVFEIEDQAADLKTNFKHIALASGSGGTHAGLLAGYAFLNKEVNIQAYNVQNEREPLLSETFKIAENILQLLDASQFSNNIKYHLSNDYVGESYGIPNRETWQTIKLMAQNEGVILDPVYTGKAFTGFLNDINMGKFPKNEPLLFIHTGGTPGIFAYNNDFEQFLRKK